MTDLPTETALPPALVERPQWVCWRAEDRDGTPTKVPVDATTDGYASTTDASTWTTFATAREHASATGCGVGFVFTDDDPLVGVDLDDCRDLETGQLDEPAKEIVTRLESFTEVSPSGTGVHVIVTGTLPAGRNRHGDVELYDTSRFFTVTGDHLSETPPTVEQRDEPLTAVHEEYVAVEEPTTTSDEADHTDATIPTAARVDDHEGNDLTDTELLEHAKAAANGAKFTRLYRGSTAGYPSQSEADMALCSLLAFWTGGDAPQMDRLFRDSGLMREKWDEVHFADGATYGERTIERAIAGTDDFYTGEGASWTLPSGESAGSAPSTEDATPSDEPAVADATLADLRERLDELEAENERLREELAAERQRREELETAMEEQSPGLLTRLFSR